MPRILVIDDNNRFRALLKETLVSEGYEVVTASDGKEGLALYRQQPADLIITDVLMPEKDGIEIIVDLKKDFPDVKIIIISGGGKEGSAEDYLESVGTMCNIKYAFPKPFKMDKMLEKVKEILDGENKNPGEIN